MSNVFCVADTHFSHSNIIKYCNRPFKNSNEMDEKIIENWNKKIKSNSDIVYFLGDFCFTRNSNEIERFAKRLNGQKNFIFGNHDRKDWIRKSGQFQRTGDIIDFKFDDKYIVCCHFPLATWNRAHHGAWHLFGHTHGTEHHEEGEIVSLLKNAMNVGIDCHKSFEPFSWEEIKEYMKKFN